MIRMPVYLHMCEEEKTKNVVQFPRFQVDAFSVKFIFKWIFPSVQIK